MAVWSKLTTYVDPRPMNGSAHDDPGYPRHKIDRVVIHHNSTTNYRVALDTWLKGGKMTSAHYEITPTQIIGCVDETRSAWHAGNKLMNQRSIGLEHVNSSGAPNWSVAEETLKLSAKLCADICKRYGIPIDSAHIVPHKSIVATDCPGGINMNHYIDLVRQAAGQTMTPATPAPAPAAEPSQSAPAAKLAVDGYWGVQLTKAMQKLYGTTQDGVVSSQYNWKNAGLTSGWQFVLQASAVKGSLLIAAIQRALGVKADGKLGPETIKAMQRKAGTPVDGVISAKSQLVMYMQRCANIGKNPF
ncbi:N-acetylmuramoyl-L-alanine amidase [Lacticaseibacillus sp. 53-4]|uniref:peptidoglycan recognition protein family protein n=1 Tax=Lacticaseibacillus sp. 53-4 TaxID=2799575 RepID=UPI001940D207|nr:N-acetylmuramoyl-L-alanine amidase [Lacticaseibacillus sp. 53-4]